MFPGIHLKALGLSISLWNLVFLAGATAGWLVFRVAARREEPALGCIDLRFGLVVYLSALAAQGFAYAFDTHTTLLPPLGTSAVAYYLDPLAGPKTLYGVIVAMPATLALATLGSRVRLTRALDLWTRPMLVVLAVSRVGCLLEGCCYGTRSDVFGVSFPAGSPVFWQQVGMGLLSAGAASSLPVVPTQALEVAVLGFLAFRSRDTRIGSTVPEVASSPRLLTRRVTSPASFGAGDAPRREGKVFVAAIVTYSIFRFAVEFVRADAERGLVAGLATSQWIAIAVLIAAGGWLVPRARGSS